ncbi:beta-1,3-galactosyltransferase pvg3-like [Panicum miliaceum]|uniref:Hexosyltransferase n=1 Tax=Panicum miliaceum TaxID=4540 RepID=A0A3L6T664_PANMI|nr:beta-1,3-galactosyltransferase pvg3-like [Panicum miliaceum]
MKPPPSSCILLGAPLALLLVVFVLPSLRPPKLDADGPGALCARRAATATNVAAVAPPQDPEPELSLLIGVLTMPSRRERRDIVRMAYALQPPAARARVDVRFVFCNVTDPVDAALAAVAAWRHPGAGLRREHERRQDARVPLLRAAALRVGPLRLRDEGRRRHAPARAALVEELRSKPRADLYLGRGFPVGDDPAPFMHGMGYVVSWDVAEWVSSNEDILRNNGTRGHEDRLLGKWLNAGGRGKKRYNLKPRMYDVHWDVDNFWPDTVAVHRLKDNRRWAAVFRYFNVTAGITPSNLYHLP